MLWVGYPAQSIFYPRFLLSRRLENVETTYLIIDGENIDATLGSSVLGRRPDPDERPRWDRVLDFAQSMWQGNTKALFFLNATSGQAPLTFVQALLAMGFQPILLSGSLNEKVVDIGIQRTLAAIEEQGQGCVVLCSHDRDFTQNVEDLLDSGHRVSIICFEEYLASSLRDLKEKGLTLFDFENQVHAFTKPLPRTRVIELEDFDPYIFL